MAQTTLRDYLQETEDALSSNRIDAALANCQHVLTRFPESLEAQRLLGEVYLAQGRLEEAQQTFDWVLTNDPENVIAYCDRALISERLADFDTALDCYQQAYELSRGNSQIRQEFNKLSAKAGQQGFMFSRAGLARLYMRGDLLAQAVQEWEAVLAASPDRLDACTGLLEAYWREGRYDKVEQLAAEILQNVPGCVKALLLLAHAASTKDIQKAQELLQRVEALDPDFVLAQEIFADMLAREPEDAFLKLLRKTPVSLDPSREVVSPAPLEKTPEAVEKPSAVPSQPEPASLQESWSGIDNWNGETLIGKPRQKEETKQSQGDLPLWSSDSIALPDTWNGGVKQPEQDNKPKTAESPLQLNEGTTQNDAWNTLSQNAQSKQEESALPSWQTAQSAQEKNPIPPTRTEAEQSTWQLSGAGINGVDAWESTKDTTVAEPANAWESLQKQEMPSPPAWLSMLTQGERQQLNDENSVSSPPTIEQQKPEGQPAAHQQATPLVDAQPSWPGIAEKTPDALQSMSGIAEKAVEAQPPAPGNVEKTAESQPSWPGLAGEDDQEDEDLSFGPEWLKSLGAAAMEEEEEAPSVQSSAEEERVRQVVSEASALYKPQPLEKEITSQPPVMQPEQRAEEPDWMKQIAQAAQPATQQPVEEPDWMKQISQSTAQPAAQQPVEEPDWMKQLSQAQAGSQQAPAEEPDWMKQIAQAGSQASQQPQSPAEEPDWMKQISQSGIQSTQPAAQQPMEEPDWIKQISQSGIQPAQPAVQPAPTEEPDWMKQISQSTLQAEPQQAEEPDWMKQIAQASQPLTQQSQPNPAEEPDWMKQMSQPALPQQASAEEPDWVKQMSQSGIQSTAQPAVQPAPTEEPDWMKQMSQAQQKEQRPDQSEQNLITTLEALEKDLLSQGFVPLEPNSLSSITQAEQEEPATEKTSQPIVEEQPAHQEPTLSSALAELGNLAPKTPRLSDTLSGGATQPTPAYEEQMWPTQPAHASEEQIWTTAPWAGSLAALEAQTSSSKVPAQPAQFEASSDQMAQATPFSTSKNTANEASKRPEVTQPHQPVPGSNRPQTTRPLPEQSRPTAGLQSSGIAGGQPSSRPQVSSLRASSARMDALLDSELETTMKRPAVRLQPAKPRTTPTQRSQPAAPETAREGKRANNEIVDSSLSYQERLVKGYQHQLVGDYDEAMQEYRIIIRNAPELLGEVVSNVRALLKLAPKYAAGYRVLGDAYMRQGEYLQAMEAYNKALTMAKKARA
ncbi:tetratricopeptide repeat protein [Ktedonosporobacter rubrisoli]|uniref:Tetratricopeptide repeat protein n=1 Tax=Ktedonosporobacter rubrisoli TaxID=2509675 RepID=A0A4P6K439_KTERU|nr:tetratricopeptide repeat protein [Ktedonosporobacter rubrisoli]QBD83058.1 tetratricopeptide repeat protein [Ktedonosporobacter rubrisoli]